MIWWRHRAIGAPCNLNSSCSCARHDGRGSGSGAAAGGPGRAASPPCGPGDQYCCAGAAGGRGAALVSTPVKFLRVPGRCQGLQQADPLPPLPLGRCTSQRAWAGPPAAGGERRRSPALVPTPLVPQRRRRAGLPMGLLPAPPPQPAVVRRLGGGDGCHRRHRQGVRRAAGAPGCGAAGLVAGRCHSAGAPGYLACVSLQTGALGWRWITPSGSYQPCASPPQPPRPNRLHSTDPQHAPSAAPLPPAPTGLNLVLISRTESKLQEAAAELEGKHGVQVGGRRPGGRAQADFCPASARGRQHRQHALVPWCPTMVDDLLLLSLPVSAMHPLAACAPPRAQVRYVAADLCKAGPDTFAKIGAALEGLEASTRWLLCPLCGAALLQAVRLLLGCLTHGATCTPLPAVVPLCLQAGPGSVRSRFQGCPSALAAAPQAGATLCHGRSAALSLPHSPHAALPACTHQVGVLVNNAGLSYDHPEYLDEVEDGFVADIVTINALVPAMVGLGWGWAGWCVGAAPAWGSDGALACRAARASPSGPLSECICPSPNRLPTGTPPPAQLSPAQPCRNLILNPAHNLPPNHPTPPHSWPSWCSRACGRGGAAWLSTSAPECPQSSPPPHCSRVRAAAGACCPLVG